MSAPIAYRRRASALHAARASIGALYGVALATAALIVQHPCSLLALMVAVLGAGYASGTICQMTRTLRRAGLPILLLTVLINVLVSRGGLTVFARLGYFGPLGQLNLTLEAAAYGLIVGVRLVIVLLAAVLVSCAVDPDELLRSLRRVYPSSALSATIATRMIAVLSRDAERLAEAQRCRAAGQLDGRRARLAILRAVIAGSIERSLDVAATLEVRGYGAGAARAPCTGASPVTMPTSCSPRCDPGGCDRDRASALDSFRVYPLAARDPRPAAFAAASCSPRSPSRRFSIAGGSPRERAGRRRPQLPLPRGPGGALSDVTFALEPGEFAVVAGLSASGKSTLLRAACGLVPHFHGGEFSGRVAVAGLDTREHGPAAIGAVAGTVSRIPRPRS